uniref:Hcy-binding domain-containing protein n=1 Tax=Rhabditophanes sp. KR3021 TaxID=114890 RepID=A0AC35TXP8_9BILA
MHIRTLDGGFGTYAVHVYKTEKAKTDVSRRFWSFELALNRDYSQLFELHKRIACNGSETLFTTHYQASVPRLMMDGWDYEDIFNTFEMSYQIPKFIMNNEPDSVFVSCGPFAVFMQDNTEYSDKQNHPLTKSGLFNERLAQLYYQIQISTLCLIDPDVIVFETLGLIEEAQVIIKVMKEQHPTIKYGLSFAFKDGISTYAASDIQHCFMVVAESEATYFGLNCTDPKLVTNLLTTIKNIATPHKQLSLILKPNCGQLTFMPDSRVITNVKAKKIVDYIDEWRSLLPIWGIGGCCNVLPNEILSISKKLNCKLQKTNILEDKLDFYQSNLAPSTAPDSLKAVGKECTLLLDEFKKALYF